MIPYDMTVRQTDRCCRCEGSIEDGYHEIVGTALFKQPAPVRMKFKARLCADCGASLAFLNDMANVER